MTIQLPELKDYKKEDYQVATDMLNSLLFRFNNNIGATSLPYWMDKFSSQVQANRMIMRLAEEGWITTRVIKKNWAEVEIRKSKLLEEYSEEELHERIIETKLQKYAPKQTNKQNPIAGATDVKLPSGLSKTGLVRIGFAKAGTHNFKYDTAMMKKFRRQIIKYSVKSMEKLEEQLGCSLKSDLGYDFESVTELIIDTIIGDSEAEYNLGKLVLDSRGRAIYDAVKRVFNPISNKMARSLIVAPESHVDKEGLRAVYLFIAEITEGFTPDITKKQALGKKAYKNRKYLDLDMNSEKGLDDLFENIWLARVYKELEAYENNPEHKVTTPIEIDFSASNMLIIGLLLGHSDYVNHQKYMWAVDGLTKQHIKFAQTPYVFGSQASIETLWTKKKLEFTHEQKVLMRKEQVHGKFAIANIFKDIILDHCQPEKTMVLHSGTERYRVECNRHNNIGTTSTQYNIYDSEQDRLVIVKHTSTHKVPDIKNFNRFFPTGLVHNIDSQIMDNICKVLSWVIPIHDAGLVRWCEAKDMRDTAVVEMKKVKDQGKVIVENYLKSINLDNKGWAKYADLLKLIASKKKAPMVISRYLLK